MSLFPLKSTAEAAREFPATALRGELVLLSAPEVRLNGKPERLSPGARIRDPQNLLVQPASLAGHTLTVNYLRDGAGLLSEVWILSPAETQQPRASAADRRNFLFGFETDSAPSDDGKTPFEKLPRYGQPSTQAR